MIRAQQREDRWVWMRQAPIAVVVTILKSNLSVQREEIKAVTRTFDNIGP